MGRNKDRRDKVIVNTWIKNLLWNFRVEAPCCWGPGKRVTHSHHEKFWWGSESKCCLTIGPLGMGGIIIGKEQCELRPRLSHTGAQAEKLWAPKRQAIQRAHLGVLHCASSSAWLCSDHSRCTINAEWVGWRVFSCMHERMKSQCRPCPSHSKSSHMAEAGLPEHLYGSQRVVSTMSRFGCWGPGSPVSRHATASSRCVRDLFGVGEAYFCLHLLSTLLLHILLWDVKSSACAGCAVREESKQASGGVSATWPRQIVILFARGCRHLLSPFFQLSSHSWIPTPCVYSAP